MPFMCRFFCNVRIPPLKSPRTPSEAGRRWAGFLLRLRLLGGYAGIRIEPDLVHIHSGDATEYRIQVVVAVTVLFPGRAGKGGIAFLQLGVWAV